MQVIDGGKGKPEWHPIETAPRDKMVWVWHRKGDYSLAWFDTAKGRWVLHGDPNYDGPCHLKLTAWRPLPEPPPPNLQ